MTATISFETYLSTEYWNKANGKAVVWVLDRKNALVFYDKSDAEERMAELQKLPDMQNKELKVVRR